VIRVEQRQPEAELARRMAAVPTQDGMLTDRTLLDLADLLEEEALVREVSLKRQPEAE
jgi:hypothetical protein